MTNHFKLALAGILLVVLFLSGLFIHLKHKISGVLTTGNAPVHILPKDVKETVTYNDKTHTVTIVTPGHTTTEYANNPTIELKKDGTLNVQRNLAGFQNRLYVGVGYSDGLRLFVGDSLFHFSRFDINSSFAISGDKTKIALKMYSGVGWNFYSNTYLNVGVNLFSIVIKREPDIAVFVSLRI